MNTEQSRISAASFNKGSAQRIYVKTEKLFVYAALTDWFYNGDGVCLLRGTNWVFKFNSAKPQAEFRCLFAWPAMRSNAGVAKETKGRRLELRAGLCL